MTDTLVLRTGRIALGLAALTLIAVIGLRMTGDRTKPDAEAAAISGPESAEFDKAVADINARLKTNPNDVAALQALGTVSLQAQRGPQAVAAFQKAVDLQPRDSTLWSSLGAAILMSESGNGFPPAARNAFSKALAIDPKDPRARYFLAIARDSGGDAKGALDDLFALLKDSPPDAPWQAEVRGGIQALADREKIDVKARLAALPQAQTTAPTAGPSAEQQAMIAGMVDGLAAKLKAEPKNVEGWIMLMRSYVTLGRTADAATAYRSALAANPSAKGELEEAAKALGVK